jgi:hypothetical protein
MPARNTPEVVFSSITPLEEAFVLGLDLKVTEANWPLQARKAVRAFVVVLVLLGIVLWVLEVEVVSLVVLGVLGIRLISMFKVSAIPKRL